MTFKSSLRLGVCGAAIGFAVLIGGGANAQAVQASSADTSISSQDEKAEETIVVVGTNISGVKPVGSEAVSLNREQIIASGMTSPADVVRTLPQVRNLGEYREGGTYGSGNAQQGNAINLRGLGPAATLILVDGRRVVATGAAATFTEANQVPLAALQRIDVIADGASAVYGSDAVAGVVNYVLRKDFEGVEASFRVSNNNGGLEMTPSVTAGTHWDVGGLGAGNIIVSYEHTSRDPYLRGKNKWLMQDLRAVGGPDTRINGATGSAGSPGNIVVGTPGTNNLALPLAGANVYYGLPGSVSGNGITVSQLRLNDPNLIDTADFTDYTGEVTRDQVSAYFNQQLGDNVTLFASGGYSKRHTYSRQIASFSGSLTNVTVPAFLYDPVTNLPDPSKPNPAYISGIPGVAPGAPLTVQYNFSSSTGVNNWDNKVENYNITGGFTAKLPMDWNVEAYYTYGYDDACNYCNIGNNINPDSLQYLINIGSINPLSTQDISSDLLARIYGDNIQQSGNTFNDWLVKFDGPLFALPGGTARAAFGGEITKQSNWNVNGRHRGIDNDYVIDTDKTTSMGNRTIKSAFAELYLPLISQDMDVSFIQDLTLSGAVRHDDYSDVGSTTNPKIGLTWVVSDALTLRGSWGTSFRAPGLPDVNPSAFSSAFVFSNIPNNNPNIANDVCFGPTCLTTIGLVYGANAEIGPEKATNWSMGADLSPFPNLRIGATYYNIAYKNRIMMPSFGLIGNFINPGYPDYAGYDYAIMPINNTNVTGPDTCTIDPVLQEYLDRPIMYGMRLINPCTIRGLLDGRNVNLAATQQDGIDVQIDYSIPFDGGEIVLNAAVNKVLHNKQQILPGAAFVDVKNRADQPIEWKGRSAIGVNWQNINAMLFVNYTGGYDNTSAVNPVDGTPVGTQRVGSWTTFDFNLGYGRVLENSVFKGIRASVNVQNLTDKDPPLVITSNSAFNASYSNPFGRTFTAQISASF